MKLEQRLLNYCGDLEGAEPIPEDYDLKGDIRLVVALLINYRSTLEMALVKGRKFQDYADKQAGWSE